MSFYLLVLADRLAVLLQLFHGTFELLRTELTLEFLSFPAGGELTSLSPGVGSRKKPLKKHFKTSGPGTLLGPVSFSK